MDGVAADRLGELVARGGVCALSGAGLSTESGIPDYRGPGRAHRARLPMTIAEFRGSPAARQRYWARAHIGWRRIAAAQPNAGHRAVSALQQAGVLGAIITQNVDGLHQAAGARDVVELHGTLDRVVCLECGARSTRQALDQRLRAANPDLDCDEVAISNPDGDVELAERQAARYRAAAPAPVQRMPRAARSQGSATALPGAAVEPQFVQRGSIDDSGGGDTPKRAPAGLLIRSGSLVPKGGAQILEQTRKPNARRSKVSVMQAIVSTPSRTRTGDLLRERQAS